VKRSFPWSFFTTTADHALTLSFCGLPAGRLFPALSPANDRMEVCKSSGSGPALLHFWTGRLISLAWAIAGDIIPGSFPRLDSIVPVSLFRGDFSS